MYILHSLTSLTLHAVATMIILNCPPGVIHYLLWRVMAPPWAMLSSLSEAISSSKWPPWWSAFGGHLEGQMASERELNIAQGGAITYQSKWWIDSRWTIWFILKPISGQYHFLWKASTCLAHEHLGSNLLLSNSLANQHHVVLLRYSMVGLAKHEQTWVWDWERDLDWD